MTMNKRTLVRLSWMAHLVIALILCDLVPSIIGRVLLLAAIGVIGGIQGICIMGTHDKQSEETKSAVVNAADDRSSLS